MKIDDRLHSHRKTRKVVRSHEDKGRDIAPMGLWVTAGSWAGQNGTDGWVPKHELDRWDDEWETLAHRLVKAEYWWPEEREGEAGFGFVDWQDYNPASGSAAAGAFGNHKRWHADKGVVKPGCPHCPAIPDDLDLPDPESGGDIGGESGGDIASESRIIALPDPTRPEPDPKKDSCASADAEREFDEWYRIYPRKRARGQALKAYKAARKKTDHATLVGAVQAQATYLTKGGPEFAPYPATWLNGERWGDDLDTEVEDDPWAHLKTPEQIQAERGF